MFKVPVRWSDSGGDELSFVAVLHAIPHVGDRVDLTALQAQVAEHYAPEARHLDCFRVLAVEHGASAFSEDDEPGFLAADPRLAVLLERDPEVQHQMELEEQRELTDSVRQSVSRLMGVLNSFALDQEYEGKFALVGREGDCEKGPAVLLVFRFDGPDGSSPPAFAFEVADVVFCKVPGQDSTWRCVKHRYRVLPDPPFETRWTGVV